MSLVCPRFEKLVLLIFYRDGCHFTGLYEIDPLIRTFK